MSKRPRLEAVPPLEGADDGPPVADVVLRLCPDCQGFEPGRLSCERCEGSGVLDLGGRPFHAPPPFDEWAPRQLVALDRAHRERTRTTPANTTTTTGGPATMTKPRTGAAKPPARAPHRLSLSEIVELLLTRSASDHSTVKLTRNARGGTQVEVSVRTGEPGLETVEEATAKAREVYDELTAAYPPPEDG